MSHKRNDGNASDKDSARTPPSLFKKLNERWKFTVDIFADDSNYLCPQYFTKESNGGRGFLSPLASLYKGDVAYGNCPYSNPEPFIIKAYEESLKGATAMNPTLKESSLGLWLVLLGTSISVIGVWYNNVLLEHTAAMLIWRWSNIIFLVYFVSRWRKWVDGGLSDLIMSGLYLFYVVTNEWGIEHV